MGTRSPHKRGTTPPQSPPTPHKIELIENSEVQPPVTVDPPRPLQPRPKRG